MMSARGTPEGNARCSVEALKFAQVFIQLEKQYFQTKNKSNLTQDNKEKSLLDLYHYQSILNWNGQTHKSKTSIEKFYQAQKIVETTLQALDSQIMPPMGDTVDMITIIAGGTIKHNHKTFNFSRVFLLGPAPGSTDYLIVSDTLKLQE